MAKKRNSIRMSEAEIEGFLDQAHSLQVATIGKDGAPHLTTVWFAVKDGLFLFETYGKSQKIVNMRRDNHVALLAEDGKTYDELRGVSINGRAEIVEQEPRLSELMRLLIDTHFPGQTVEQLDAMTKSMAAKRVVVAVQPDKVMSWDHGKLGGVGP